MAVALGAYFAFRPIQRLFPMGGSLTIGDDFIESRTLLRWSEHKKRIGREKIKSISQNRQGLCVMDRGEFGARMLGFVFVPATMPEYQEIRAELAQWASIQGKS